MAGEVELGRFGREKSVRPREGEAVEEEVDHTNS